MLQIEIPQEYWEFLFLKCAETRMIPEEYMELLISGYLERNQEHE